MSQLPQPRHSPHGYGLLCMADVPFLEQAIVRVDSQHEKLSMLELGVANGGTTAGVYNFCHRLGIRFQWTGMDHACGRPGFPLGDWGKFIEGDLYHPKNWDQVSDDINLLFVDCCHCFTHTVEAFELYKDKVVKDGYVLFHDTCSHRDWQNNPAPHLAQCAPDRFIETRRAINWLGLMPGGLLLEGGDFRFIGEQDSGTGQGMYLVKKQL